MQNYHLVPKGEQWELAPEGGPALATFHTKEQAVQISRRSLDRDAGPLKVHRADGTIEAVVIGSAFLSLFQA
jgi:hypothetical protein